VAEFQHEINRLTRELDQAHTEKVQSATYGLSLLEEKQSLTKRYEELENLYENVRQELDITQEVIMLIEYFMIFIYIIIFSLNKIAYIMEFFNFSISAIRFYYVIIDINK